MYAKAALICAAVGSLVSATVDVPEPAVKAARAVKPRQTSDNLLSSIFRLANEFDVRACIPGALPLVTELPKIPPGLLGNAFINQALSQTTLELSQVCDFSITGDVGDTFTSFLPTWYSWYHEHSSRIGGIVTACPSATSLVHTVEAYESCEQVPKTEDGASVATATTETVGTASETDTSSVLSIQTDTVVGGDDSTTPGTTAAETAPAETATTTTEPSSSVQEAVAPCETGFMFSAAAAAGFIGVVAAL